MVDQKKQGKKEIKIADNIPGAEYANAMQLNHSKDEVQLMFLNIFAASGRVTSKLVTSPGHFKRMIKAMNENLDKYEKQFGKIEETKVDNNEIGFKA